VLLTTIALTPAGPTGSIDAMSRRTRSDAPPVAGSGEPGPESGSDGRREEGSFESSLHALESIVDRLEAGDLPLEEALALFEKGVALTRRCAEQLAAAERRIELLVREGASWGARPFEESEETD
jgi:exodeoxyribonuclease VII small subunit